MMPDYLQKLEEVGELVKNEHAQVVESQNMILSLIDHLPGYIVAKDLDGCIVWCNLNTLRHLGMESDKVFGNHCEELFPDASCHREVDARVVETGMSELIKERVRTPDGKYASYRTLKVPTRDARGEVTGLLSFAQLVRPEEGLSDATNIETQQ